MRGAASRAARDSAGCIPTPTPTPTPTSTPSPYPTPNPTPSPSLSCCARLCRMRRSERSAKTPPSLPPAHRTPPGPHSAPSAAEAAGAVDGSPLALPPPPSPPSPPPPSPPPPSPSPPPATVLSFSRPRLLLLDTRRAGSLESLVAGAASARSSSSPAVSTEQGRA